MKLIPNLCWYILIVNINFWSDILKINDMRRLANAYMQQGDLYRGEDTAAKVNVTIFQRVVYILAKTNWHTVLFTNMSLFFKFTLLQWYTEALRIAIEHVGENSELCSVIYYNTGLHRQQRGELQKAYECFKQGYLIQKEVNIIWTVLNNMLVYSLLNSNHNLLKQLTIESFSDTFLPFLKIHFIC